jgi:hypothetical protein
MYADVFKIKEKKSKAIYAAKIIKGRADLMNSLE